MRLIVEATLAAGAIAVLWMLWRERSVAHRAMPLAAAAVPSTVGVVLGGTAEVRLWGVAALGYAFSAVLVTASSRSPAMAIEMPGVGRLLLFASLVFWLLIVDFTVGKNASGHLVSYTLVLVAIVASGALVGSGGVPPSAAAAVGLLVVAGADVAAPFAHTPWRDCDQFKCGVAHALFRGPFPSENFLALVATMTFAWTLSALRSRVRVAGGTLCLATVVFTGSRTGLIVCGLSLAGLFAVRLLRKRHRTGVLSFPVACAAPVAAAALGFYLLYSASTTSFSNRGSVWLAALTMVQNHHLVGIGISSYSVLQSEGVVSQHFTHSEYLLLLFGGGYIAVALFVAWAAASVRALSGAQRDLAGLLPIIAFLAYGLSEASWNPLAFDAFAWIAVALTVTRSGGLERELAAAQSLSPDATQVVASRRGSLTVRPKHL